jgi:phosphomannomutase
MMDNKNLKLVVADLDGTISKSKQRMDLEMSDLLAELLTYKDFAVISGGSYKQFQDQFVNALNNKTDRLSHLYLFPTCATSMYVMKNGSWNMIYKESIPQNTKKEIFAAFEKSLSEYGFKEPETVYGEIIEDRETQITFSAHGQLAPLEIKEIWDPDHKKRLAIIGILSKYLPDGYQAKIGGTTSIDVTKIGIDKEYGILKIKENLGFEIKEMLFIGDALFEGGNDYPVKKTGVECIQVKDPEETKKVIRQIITESKTVIL